MTAEQMAAQARGASPARVWRTLRLRWGMILKALVVAALMGWPLTSESLYGLSVMTTAGLFTILTISVGLVLGQAGQLSFGHSAFYGIGAYTAALTASEWGFPTGAGLLAGAIVAGLIALLIGRPVLRLRYFYLALATIGLGQIFLVLVIELRDLTGGAQGFAPVPPLEVLGFEFDSYFRQYYLVWIVALVFLLFTQRALKFRVGRSLRALATSEIAASTLGVRTPNWKLLAFVTSAVYCGTAGALFAFVTGAISPMSFSFNAAVLPVIMMLIGGAETVWGAIAGAVIMTWVGNSLSGAQQYSGLVYSVIMLLLLLFVPTGLLNGLRAEHRARLRRLLRRAGRGQPAECALAAEQERSADQCETRLALPVSSAAQAADLASGEAAYRDEAGELLGALAASRGGDGESPLLVVENVSVDFGGLRAVSDVSLQVREGHVSALIGPNGAGKTTLFNVISHLQKPSSGKVVFRGTETTSLQPADTARLGVARTFQNLRIFENMSVLENVLVGRHRHERAGLFTTGLGLPRQRREDRRSRACAKEALSLVGLEEHADRPAASLPYGQQRLVEIARALASEPRLLLLDEPAAGMNAQERSHLVERVRRIREAGVTVLLVEHDIELVMGLSDHVSVLDHGALIAAGEPERVQNDPAVIEAYLGISQDRERDLCRTRGLCAPSGAAEAVDVLRVQDLSTSYGSIQALQGVSFSVARGEIVAVLGANGAGKTTLLNTISGVLRASGGSVRYQGDDITSLASDKIAARGLCQVPEGRQVFPSLSVEDNLLVGASGRKKGRKDLADDLAFAYDLFPVLGERRQQLAGTLSGGEQQMLAICRALTGRPQLLLLDEPSMGLAPLVVEHIFEALARLNEQGLTMLMVEQNAEMALSVAHRAVVLQTGLVALSGMATKLRQDERVRECYLGQVEPCAVIATV